MVQRGIAFYDTDAQSLAQRLGQLSPALRDTLLRSAECLEATKILTQHGIDASKDIYERQVTAAIQMAGLYTVARRLEPDLPPEMHGLFAQELLRAMAKNRQVGDTAHRRIVGELERFAPPAESGRDGKDDNWTLTDAL